MLVKRAYLSFAAICFILGLMLSAQYKANQNSPTYFSPDRWAEVVIQTEHLKNQHAALENEAISLRYKISHSDKKAKEQAVNDMLNKANIAAGVTTVTGPGIIVSLDYPAKQKNSLYFPMEYNILSIINELNAAGAECISINGQRIVGYSQIYSGMNGLQVNGVTLKAPYEIRAIGDPNILVSSLNLKGGILQVLSLSGFEVKIQKTDKLDIPAYAGKLVFQYATPFV